MSDGVIVVGAGQAGAEFVRALRQDGYEGPVRLIGREPHPPYDRPPLSKKFLLEAMAPERLYLRARDAYVRSQVDLLTGCAVAGIDPAGKRLRLETGDTLSFDACVLATGASARRPDIAGMALDGIHAIRTLDDALALRQALRPGARLVVVGGGYLGLEAASSARKIGADVVVIEGAPALLQRSVSPVTAAAIAARHRSAGTRLLLGTTVRSFDGEGRIASVTTSQGETIAADLVLIAVGADPEIGLARHAGLRCDNGVLVDEACRSSTADVYAIGDCANQLHPLYGRHLRLEAISSALFHARSAAAAIMGKALPPAKPPFFWSEQCDFKLQMLGVPHPGLACENVHRGDDRAFSVYRFQEGTLVAVETLNRPADFVRAQAMIGRRDVTLPAT